MTDTTPPAPTTDLEVAEAAEARLVQMGDKQQTFEQMHELAKTIASTEFVPKGLQGRPAAVLACILTGRELGIEPMQSLRQIYVTEDGKVGLEAELMLAKMREAGVKVDGSVDEAGATLTGVRPNGETMTVTFTLQEADRAGLLGKHNWKKYPQDMMWARAVSRLYRRLAPDVAGGASHTPEELGAINSDVIYEAPAEDMLSAEGVYRLEAALSYAVGMDAGEQWKLEAVLKQAARTFRPIIRETTDLTKSEASQIANTLKAQTDVDWRDDKFAPPPIEEGDVETAADPELDAPAAS